MLHLKIIPKLPGIYKYFDVKGNIIYIGKSINLFSRVNSYFNGKSKLNFAKKKMVNQIVTIETIITNNETESLLLETNLIKKYKPKYNILMKDDKNHLYIKITKDPYPKILKTRIKYKDGIYFGPYISTFHVNNILKVIKKYFGYGAYGIHFFKDSTGYNLDKYLFKNNIDNSTGKFSETEKQLCYGNQIESIKQFLKGNLKEVEEVLEKKMKKYASQLLFEEAQKTKAQLDSLKTLQIEQTMRNTIQGDYDFVNIIDKYGKYYIGLTQLRQSLVKGYYNYTIENKLEESKEEILQKFIEKNYIENQVNSEYFHYILPFDIPIEIPKIKIEVPKIGSKLDLLKLTYKNIYEYACKSHLDSLSTKGFSKQTMMNLLHLLNYKIINKNILFECNDISHYAGSHTVASRSIIESGKSNPSKYKKFKIKTLEDGKIDDFGSMKEVMDRRLKEVIKSDYIPDLIIIDGGKGQLSSVLKIIKEYGLEEKIQTVGIAKREEELFLPGQSESILLKKDSLELRLIQKIRDEAHRFAITYNRAKRIKSMKKNILESLPGFGIVSRKKILKKYGNIDNLYNLSITELKELLNRQQIETLRDHGLIK